jgi:hypothetical protein
MRREVLHFGDTYNSMRTRERRITVRNDRELASALERARGTFPGSPVGVLVRELALIGAAALEGGGEGRRAARVWIAQEGRPEAL